MSARVNLLPREIAERARVRRSASWTIAGVAVFAALLGLLYLGKLGQVNAAEDERDEAQATVTQLQAELATLQEFAELDRKVKARNQLLSAAMATEISWARTLNDLALTFPASSSLTELNAAMAGAADAGGVADESVSAEAIASLRFAGYSVERFAPGVERVLLKFSDVGMFFNSYLAQAATELRGETLVTGFDGSTELSEQARTNRYAEGLPPEVGQ